MSIPNPNDPLKQPPPFGNQNPYASSPVGAPVYGSPYSSPHAYPQTGDGTGGVIPYKNPLALIAYYCAVFSLLPCLGIPIGMAAFILGILGLRAAQKNPIIKGSVHAWIGIIGGLLLPLLQIGGIFAFFLLTSR